MYMEKACKDCHRIIEAGKAVCKCGSNALSKDWIGYVIIVDAEGSEIARRLEIKTEGRYALKVR
ncbi:MAG: transcription elongation factor subunit Spt4 [Candidatus Methanospirareceae archaeon]